MLLALILCFIGSLPPVSGRFQLTVGGNTYSARIAAFGDPLVNASLISGTLMLPRDDDKYLCEFPSDLENVTVSYSNSVALLVSQGGDCIAEDKAKIGLELHQKFSSDIHYIVIYDDDKWNFDYVPELQLINGHYSEFDDDLAFISVSTAAGPSIQADVWDHAANTGDNPFLAPVNMGWDMPFFLRLEDEADEDDDDPPLTSGNSSQHLFAFLICFILFGLFIVAPCICAVYLWRAGGGAIAFRRNEEGRITGIQYVQPEPNWFWMVRRPTTNRAENATLKRQGSLLTEDQVLALPEINYQKETMADDEELGSVVNAISEQAPVEPPEAVPRQDEQEYTTTCTSCSICIEDFTAGEKICVLPRCRHAYHTQCFIPWATERHGTCPLCKVRVLETDEQHTEAQEAEAGEDQTPEEEA